MAEGTSLNAYIQRVSTAVIYPSMILRQKQKKGKCDYFISISYFLKADRNILEYLVAILFSIAPELGFLLSISPLLKIIEN